MIKLFVGLIVGLMFMASNVYSMTNRDDFQIWRSSETSSIDNGVVVATNGPIIIHDILVTSGSYTVGSTVTYPVPFCTFQYHVSSITYGNFSQLITSTSPVYDVSTTGNYFPLDEYIYGTFLYTKATGRCSIRIRWNYYLSPPFGRGNIGLKQ